MTQQHPDFQSHPWCTTLLSNPTLKWKHRTLLPEQHPTSPADPSAADNSMFRTLYNNPQGIRAHATTQRPATSPDALPNTTEELALVSIGSGLDGKAGRAHGGFSSLLLDQVAGSCAHHAFARRAAPPATATLTVDFKAPIDTPAVVVCRAWVVERSGRKVWVKGVIEDGEGRLLAGSRVLFIAPRDAVL